MASAFGLDDDTWLRHANPWSVYTRYTALPLLLLAIWSRRWLGYGAVIPVMLSVLWIWWNPRLFARPRATDNWASRAVFGERIYLRRRELELPPVHRSPVLTITKVLAGVGFFTALWAIWIYSVEWAVSGTVLAMVSKSWFLDRMVWLFEDMKPQHAEFREWEYVDSADR